MEKKFILILSLLISLSGCKEALDQHFSVVPSILHETNVPGVSIHLFQLDDDGNTVYDWSGAYGVASYDPTNTQWVKVDPDKTVFHGASLAKPLAAFGLRKMIKQELQSRGDSRSVHQILTEHVKDQDIAPCDLELCVNEESLTLHDMVYHHTNFKTWHWLKEGYFGLEQYKPYLNDNDDGNDYLGMPTIKENIVDGYVSDTYPIGSNGKVAKAHSGYSNAHYALIQYVMEKVIEDNNLVDQPDEHRRFADYMDDNILASLAMDKSTYQYRKSFLFDEGNTELATGYKKFMWDVVTTEDGDSYEPACATENGCPDVEAYPSFIFSGKAAAGLYTSPKSYAKFLREMVTDQAFANVLNRGIMPIKDICIVIDEKADEPIILRSFKKFDCDAKKTLMVLSGRSPSEIAVKNEPVYFHGGDVYGTHSRFVCAQKTKACIIVMANSGVYHSATKPAELTDKVLDLWHQVVIQDEAWVAETY